MVTTIAWIVREFVAFAGYLLLIWFVCHSRNMVVEHVGPTPSIHIEK